jgi:hypothetical protein
MDGVVIGVFAELSGFFARWWTLVYMLLAETESAGTIEIAYVLAVLLTTHVPTPAILDFGGRRSAMPAITTAMMRGTHMEINAVYRWGLRSGSAGGDLSE